MKTIHIEKYVDGVPQEVLSLPIAPIRMLAGLLPAEARWRLQQHGLDLDLLLEDTPNVPAQWLEVEEGAVAKRIRISRTD
ncbi:hypothetical protein [Devosia sp.]|uniref:hypothetical protein n=1 Tax=Devosia sp. TaxID=1871048 RepID=UPI001AC44A8E|nr:hypothetical protein [Devosia sp.]MBN9333236.1 hypothetical protein [Devosia sp.]